MNSAPREATSAPRVSLRSLAGMFGASDVVMAAYLIVMLGIVVGARGGPALVRSARELVLMLLVLVVSCAFARAPTRLPAWVRSAVYRLSSLGLLLTSYLMLRHLLPAVRPDNVDSTLLAADIRLFGVEPTLALEPYTTPKVVEFFSFFYFSYFAICLFYVAGVVGVNSSPRATSEFAIGSALVYCVGQLGYVAVPAHGPVHYLQHQFAEPLTGGFFFARVIETVNAGSAMKDVFPSLHTAAPVWFSLFARERVKAGGGRAWRAVYTVTAFFAVNIVLSTVILRWHYVVDVFAGLALAFGVGWVVPRAADLEFEFRRKLGLGPAWSFD